MMLKRTTLTLKADSCFIYNNYKNMDLHAAKNVLWFVREVHNIKTFIIITSSQYNPTNPCLRCSGRLFMNRRNRSGPNTDLCGTPISMSKCFVFIPLYFTESFLLDTKDENHLDAIPVQEFRKKRNII